MVLMIQQLPVRIRVLGFHPANLDETSLKGGHPERPEVICRLAIGAKIYRLESTAAASPISVLDGILTAVVLITIVG